jgi:hypothetical protein
MNDNKTENGGGCCPCENAEQTMTDAEKNQNRLEESEVREVYKNTCLGKESVQILKKFSMDKTFTDLLVRQYKEYAKLNAEIEAYAEENGYDLHSPSQMAVNMMYVTTAVNTLSDKSSSKLAEIMIQGIDMGIISTTKLINKLSQDNKECTLAQDLLRVLNENLDEMKAYL